MLCPDWRLQTLVKEILPVLFMLSHASILKRRFHNTIVDLINNPRTKEFRPLILLILFSSHENKKSSMSWPKVSKEYAKLAVGLRRGTSVRSSAATDYYATFTEKNNYCIKFY